MKKIRKLLKAVSVTLALATTMTALSIPGTVSAAKPARVTTRPLSSFKGLPFKPVFLPTEDELRQKYEAQLASLGSQNSSKAEPAKDTTPKKAGTPVKQNTSTGGSSVTTPLTNAGNGSNPTVDCDRNTFETALAGLLGACESKPVQVSDIQEVIKEVPTDNGVWVPVKYRNFFISLINSVSAYTFMINEKGYLVKDQSVPANQTKSVLYGDKINALATGKTRIILSFSNVMWCFKDGQKTVAGESIQDSLSFTVTNKNDKILLLTSKALTYANTQEKQDKAIQLLKLIFKDGSDQSAKIHQELTDKSKANTSSSSTSSSTSSSSSSSSSSSTVSSSSSASSSSMASNSSASGNASSSSSSLSSSSVSSSSSTSSSNTASSSSASSTGTASSGNSSSSSSAVSSSSSASSSSVVSSSSLASSSSKASNVSSSSSLNTASSSSSSGSSVDNSQAQNTQNTSYMPSTSSPKPAVQNGGQQPGSESSQSSGTSKLASDVSSQPATTAQSDANSLADELSVIEPTNGIDPASEDAFHIALAGLVGNMQDSFSKAQAEAAVQSVPTGNGIWVPESSRELILTLINSISAVTFEINAQGYLAVKDGAPVDGKKSQIFADKLIALISGNERIIVGAAPGISYYDQASDSSYSRFFFNIDSMELQSGSDRLILLNNTVFNLSYSEDRYSIMAVRFLTQLVSDGTSLAETITNELESRKNTQKSNLLRNSLISPMGIVEDHIDANMLSAQSTYAGPSSSIYARLGSVDNNEHVVVLECELGWLQIEYSTSGGNKRAYVPGNSVSGGTSNIILAYFGNGYYNAPRNNATVYSLPSTTGVTIGSVGAGEGVTVLESNGTTDYIEYSTASGTKRGYIQHSLMRSNGSGAIASVTASSTAAYAGPDINYAPVGSIYNNEYTVVMAYNSTWAYVEYNTPSGRKRGYVQLNTLGNHGPLSGSILNYRNLGVATAALKAYTGPSSNYASMGSVFNGDKVNVLSANEDGWAYVEYYTGNAKSKRGYVSPGSISLISLNSLPIPSGYNSFTYGISGNGKPLNAYKVGNGDNVLIAVFEQHGFEDGWAADGEELVKIGNDLVSNVAGQANTSFMANWSVYIVPSANPDGLLDGWTNNGEGRCTLSTRDDMNRSYPSLFTAITDRTNNRNFTGETASISPETKALENFVQQNKSRVQKTVLLDVHGWENSAIGDATVGQYFANQLGVNIKVLNPNDGGGYLIKWATSQGIKSSLVELPLPSNSQDVINRGLSAKFSTAVLNLLGNYSVSNNHMLTLGSSGEEVTVLQAYLKQNGYYDSSVDGDFATVTKAAVESYQTAHSLTIDGQVGRETWNSMGFAVDNSGAVIHTSDIYQKYLAIANNYIKNGTPDFYLQAGDSGEEVEILQAYLKINGYYNSSVDGYYGSLTQSAVRNFQAIYSNLHTNPITINGKVGRQTWLAMGFDVDSYGELLKSNDEFYYYNEIAAEYKSGVDIQKPVYKNDADYDVENPTDAPSALRKLYGVGNDNDFADGLYYILPQLIRTKVDDWVTANQSLKQTNPNLYNTRYADEVLNRFDTYKTYQDVFDSMQSAFNSSDPLVVLAAGIVNFGVNKPDVEFGKLKYNGLNRYGNKTWKSTATGLIYSYDGEFGNKVNHIINHCDVEYVTNGEGQIVRNPKHSVFSVPKNQILSLVDEAWLKAVEDPNNPTIYYAEMNRKIGDQNETKIEIVVTKDMRILSAYPCK